LQAPVRPRGQGASDSDWYNPDVAARERVYRTEAVVLRRGDLGEADRLLTVFSPKYGKIRLVAKGVRRPTSRKAGHLEPLTRVELLLAKGRELDIITQAQSLETYPLPAEDLERLGYAFYAAELVDRFSVAEGEARIQYRLLTDTLQRLSAGAEAGPIIRHFELRLLEITGYRPELFRCVGCTAEIRPESQFFSSELGGVLCPTCGKARGEALPVSLGALRVLRHYQRSTYAVAAGARVSEAVMQEMEGLMQVYMSHLLERRLNVPAFLHQVRELP
jgi:DNA repair protein RecO (recombination protein O)